MMKGHVTCSSQMFKFISQTETNTLSTYFCSPLVVEPNVLGVQGLKYFCFGTFSGGIVTFWVEYSTCVYINMCNDLNSWLYSSKSKFYLSIPSIVEIPQQAFINIKLSSFMELRAFYGWP